MWPAGAQRALTVFAAVALLVSLSILLVFPEIAQASPDGQRRGPIFIEGNGGFTRENGIVGGAGTPGDPYIIEGWEIEAISSAGILIRDTYAHFVIQSVHINSTVRSFGGPNGIHLLNVTNGRVSSSNLSGLGTNGVAVSSSSAITISNNSVSSNLNAGIAIETSTRITITGNMAFENYAGISVTGSSSFVSITSNDLSENFFGVQLRGKASAGAATRLRDVTVSANNVSLNSRGIDLRHVHDSVIQENNFTNSGVSLSGSTNVVIEQNVVVENKAGIVISGSATISVGHNRVSNIVLSSSTGVAVYGNGLSSGGLTIAGLTLPHFNSHTVSPNNLVNGLPLLYHNGCDGLVVDGVPVGQLIVTDCRSLRISNLTIVDTAVAVDVSFSEEVSVENNRIVENDGGIRIRASTGVFVASNYVWSNREFGIEILGHPWSDAMYLGPVIRGNTIVENGGGLLLSRSSEARVAENHISSNGRGGIRLHVSTGPTIAGNTLRNNEKGVFLASVTDAAIFDNRFHNNSEGGIVPWFSENLTIMGNTFTLDGLRLVVDVRFLGLDLRYYTSHQITPNNTVNGHPLRYYKDCDGLSIDGDSVGQLIITNCRDVLVTNLTIGGTSDAIQMARVSDVVISNTSLSNNGRGIGIVDSSNLTLTENAVSHNGAGVLLGGSQGVLVERNEVSSNKGQGLWLWRTNHATIVDNFLLDNGKGVELQQAIYVIIRSNDVSRNRVGLYAHGYIQDCPAGCIYTSGNVQILTNTIWRNRIGLLLVASDFRIVDNLISSNTEAGISLPLSRAVQVYHNDIVNNEVQAIDRSGIANEWDSGYPAGGNYWSDYGGIDKCSGPNQTVCPDPDGIGDTPYLIEEDVQDGYPLIEPRNVNNTAPIASFSLSHSVAVEGMVVSGDASGSWDPEDPISHLEVRWDWEDDGIWDTPWTIQKLAEHQYSGRGTYTVRLAVRDPGGLTDEATGVADALPPVILHRPPVEVSPGEDIVITAIVTDIVGVANASLHYRPDGETEYSRVAMRFTGNNTYAAEIPGQGLVGLVHYYFVAKDETGNAVRNPEVGEYVIEVGLKSAALSPASRATVVLAGVALLLLLYVLLPRLKHPRTRRPK